MQVVLPSVSFSRLLSCGSLLWLSTSWIVVACVPGQGDTATALFDHLYTASEEERQSLESSDEWIYEGVTAWVFQPGASVEGAVELHRLFHASMEDHFYTASGEEAEEAAAGGGYEYEAVVAMVFGDIKAARAQFDNADQLVVPLYRLWNPAGLDHFYTTSVDELATATADGGYEYEGEAAYVFPSDEAVRAALSDYSNSATEFHRFFNP